MPTNHLWRDLYQLALMETDYKKLPDRVHSAKAAIDSRLHDLQLDHGGTPAERQDISDALHGLNVLRRELEKRA